ncbi:MAG TPA: TetR/AcrR family transcriptional regulator [Solirubrobacterales bacterium]|nr:TetR/AcrR family transcriptional regulator [Solirubrobacterales bacterium]
MVDEYRRQRFLAALTEAAHEEGIPDVSAAKIVERTPMSRGTFYELFDSKDQCLQFCFEESFKLLFEPVWAASDSTAIWIERVRAGVGALFDGIAAEPLLAEFALVHSRGVGDVTLAAGHNYEAGVTAITRLLSGGRDAAREELGSDYNEPPPTAEEFLAQAILSLAVLQIKQGSAKALPSQRDEMVILAATPFFGLEGAMRIGREQLSQSRKIA